MSGTQEEIGEGLTLEEFLALPERKPYLQYINGRIEAKVSPKRKHGIIERELMNALNRFAKRRGLGEAYPELRCTFAGSSIIPDVVFLRAEHIDRDESGEQEDETLIPPDLHVEIVSPEQSAKVPEENLAFSIANGCSLGWLIHPYKKTVTVYLPGEPPVTLGPKGILDGADVLPGFKLPVARIFGWLKH